jgi:hypothetical protein
MVKIKCTAISKKKFVDAKKQGWISTIRGQKYMLTRTNKGTALLPVCVRKS